jgi:predicted P-loop ATPase
LVEGEDNTRWIPLRIGTIDHDALTDDTLHQLWGEAVVREGRGEHWWIPSREAKTQWQGAREETTSADPWTDAVLAYMAIAAPTPGGYSPSGALEHVTLSEIWEKAFSSTQTTDLTRLTRREEMRIANILKRHDFKKVYRGVGKRLWGYIRK